MKTTSFKKWRQPHIRNKDVLTQKMPKDPLNYIQRLYIPFCIIFYFGLFLLIMKSLLASNIEKGVQVFNLEVSNNHLTLLNLLDCKYNIIICLKRAQCTEHRCIDSRMWETYLPYASIRLIIIKLVWCNVSGNFRVNITLDNLTTVRLI